MEGGKITFCMSHANARYRSEENSPPPLSPPADPCPPAAAAAVDKYLVLAPLEIDSQHLTRATAAAAAAPGA